MSSLLGNGAYVCCQSLPPPGGSEGSPALSRPEHTDRKIDFEGRKWRGKASLEKMLLSKLLIVAREKTGKKSYVTDTNEKKNPSGYYAMELTNKLLMPCVEERQCERNLVRDIATISSLLSRRKLSG